jgi:hypothetical protein
LDILVFAIIFGPLLVGAAFFLRARKLKRLLEKKEEECEGLNKELAKAVAVAEKLSAKFSDVVDAKAEAEKIYAQARTVESNALNSAKAVMDRAEQHAESIRQKADDYAKNTRTQVEQKINDANDRAKEKVAAAESRLEAAGHQAARIIEDAKAQAEKIAGDAYKALQQADQFKASAQAMRNIIEGYGDRYMLPSHSVLDDLAQAYSHTEAGQELKNARERSKLMMEQERAAKCDYVEKNRRDAAVRFVLDAFNGKVDSILSRARTENYGTLTQEIKDAAAIVNYNGWAFRNAQINPEYINSRIDELQWTVRANQLREQEKEEQRAIKEKMREEERARKEYERAMKEAEREEELVRKALDKAQAQLAKASEEQRQKYEDQIQQLNQKLTEAEEKNKRALSMAQQTKAGHVYVISNIGSFGENVYKIGMTRRLEPLDRVRELGDASVPFGFDVHAMIWSENAPELEKALHRKFVQTQINKVNPRKEFFRLTIAEIKSEVTSRGLDASWTLAAEAREFRETLAIENKMRDDEVARNEWLRQQIVYEDRIAETEEELAN